MSLAKSIYALQGSPIRPTETAFLIINECTVFLNVSQLLITFLNIYSRYNAHINAHCKINLKIRIRVYQMKSQLVRSPGQL